MQNEFTIDHLGWHGDGVAIVDDQEIFVPFTLPDETVSGHIENGTCQNARILAPVTDRVKPICRHFKTCGGCNMQHCSDGYLADWKAQQVKNTLNLNHIETEFRPIHVSPARSRRRAVFEARRTKKSVEIGFHQRKSDLLVGVTECPLIDDKILVAFDAFKELVKIGCSRKSSIRIHVTTSQNGLDVDIENAKDITAEQIAIVAKISVDHKFARLSWNGETIALILPPAQQFGGTYVTPPPGAFLQATIKGENVLVAAATETLRDCKHVLDLFCGCGTFTLPLAKTADVHAVEAIEKMLEALHNGWRQANGLRQVTTAIRDLFYSPLLLDELKPYDGILIDPPRAGADQQVKILAKSNIPNISYISCNPATFARDAKTLIEGGYTLDWVQPVDQFRWSPHVELASQFTKSAG